MMVLLLALAIVILAMIRDRVPGQVTLRAVFGVLAAVAVFAATIRPLGLVATTIIAVVALNIMDLRTRFGEVLAAVSLSVVVVTATVIGADLPIYLWPRFGAP